MSNESKLSSLISVPYYDVIIPSSGIAAKFRAYNVKEEKQLLLADEQNDGSVMISTLNNVIKNCIIPRQERLTSFDLEYLFAQIRSKQVGEIATVVVGCSTTGCEDVKIEYQYNLSDIKIVFPEGISKLIKISDTLTIQMRYPSVEDSLDIELEKNETEKRYKAIKSQIDIIFNNGEAIQIAEESEESISSFIDSLNPQQYRKLETFFEKMPYAEGILKYRCTKCKTQHEKKVIGLASFFQ